MENVEIWSKQTTVKVMRDKTYGTEFKKPAAFCFEAAQNEHESAQIVITPQKDVSSFKIELAHVQSDDRMFYIWKDRFTVYFQKYIRVSTSSPDAEKHGNPPGYYPDALLPFEKAVEYGENKIAARNNQAIFISLSVPAGQHPGTYSGEFLLTIDGEIIPIPVKITVWDFEVSRIVHCKSDFVIGSNGLRTGENDYFPDMYRKYVEKLIEFRLAPHRVMQFLNRPYNEGADFVREVRYFTAPDKPDLSTIMLPVYPHPTTGIDEPDFKKHALALADACVEDGVNYFEKAAVYCGFIDEPQHNGNWDEVNRVCKRFEELKEETAEEFVASAPKTEFAAAVANSLRVVPNYVTIHFDERIKEVKNWCPGLAHMATKEAREKYRAAAKGGKNWWYQCGVSATTPNYGIDHNLIDARLMMWMTYDYGLEGTLYWETVQYFRWYFCLESHVNHEVAIDCYEEPIRCSHDNGDGYLFYPGKPYGIYGPVESIRLHAIRDGFEEYEYLYLLEDLCKKTGRDFRAETSALFSRLYDGVVVKADADTFDEVRRELAEKIVSIKAEAAKGEYGKG